MLLRPPDSTCIYTLLPYTALFRSVEFGTGPAEAVTLYGVGVSPCIPAPLAEVVSVRDAIAVPIHGGDITVSWTRLQIAPADRSEERRVGKEGVSTCRSRWSPYH